MTGCGSRQQVEASDSIELLEPVSAAANTEAAAYRNIYEYKVLAGTVYPYIREYSFTQDVVLTKYEKAPGDRISKGDLLISADISSIEQQIKETEEKIEQINDDYNTAVEEMEKNIQEEKNQKENEEEETEQDKLNERGWELEKNHRYELYTLDISYYTDRLEALKKKKTAYCLTSGMNGVIVSAGSYMPGTYIAADTPLIAVADESQKILKCEYVSKSDVAKCEDLYAVIDGKRYEVTYQPYDQSVYEKITTEGNVAYSSFVIEDPNNEVEQGDFAVLAEIYSRVEQVRMMVLI